MRATPLTYEHEPRRVFWVVRDLRPDPRYILGIEVASRAQLPRCAPTGGPSYVPTAQRSVWERILASPARVCMYSRRTTWSASATGDFLAGQPPSSAPSSPPRPPDGAALARAISHMPRRHGGPRATGALDDGVARGRRAEQSGRACACAHNSVRHAARCRRRGRRRARVDRIRLAGRGRCRCRRSCRVQLL